VTQLSRISGNVQVASNECDRLRALATQWEQTGHVLRVLRTDSWLGTAAEFFVAAQQERGRYWLNAADCHARAAEALQRYLDVLFEVQRLTDRVVEEASSSGDPVQIEAARQSIARWRGQLADAGRQAATIIKIATTELVTLRCVPWPPLPAHRTTRTPAASNHVRAVDQASRSRPPDRHSGQVEPPGPFDVRDQSYQRRLNELNNAVLVYWRTLRRS
jgi:hypothetical protein